MQYLKLEETDSTNSYILQHWRELDDMTMVMAQSQTAGRGQRGNTWEAEPGQNLTFSVLHYPDSFPAREQFSLSEAVALSLVETLAHYSIDAKVKWPNDIYVGDRKICGILIEHSVSGTELNRTIIGVGLNVNQTRFVSPAPNPVSMSQLTGISYDLDEVSRTLGDRLENALLSVSTHEGRTLRHQEFIHNLWRGDGCLYPFRDRDTGELFSARFSGLEPEGWLLLELPTAECRRYAFKEVEFVLPPLQ